MMTNWDADAVQQDLKRHAALKHSDVDRCKSAVRGGDEGYKRFHDEELAEAQVAFMLSTTAALASRERFLARLAGFKADIAASSLEIAGMYKQKTVDKAAIRYLERLEETYAES